MYLTLFQLCVCLFFVVSKFTVYPPSYVKLIHKTCILPFRPQIPPTSVRLAPEYPPPPAAPYTMVFIGSEGPVNSSCSGTCLAAAGYACIAGSTHAIGMACAAGQYSLGGTNSCTACSAGQYGSTTGLSNASCSGLCDAGQYGSSAGLTASSCTGSCTAGYYCPAGSTVSTANICPIGQYSTSGAASCTACAAGRYGNTTGLTSSSCSGLCEAGR